MRMVLMTCLLIALLCGKGMSQCSRMTDSLALVSIFNQTLGSGWTNKTNWLVPGRSISTWYGVKLNAFGCVESLSMPSNKMNGLLPDSVGLMTGLKVINLSNNNLVGNLPLSIGNLVALEELNLSSNQFNGPVHSQLGNLINLKKLQLSLNNFSGNLPPALGNLKNLVILHLNQNSLGGFLAPALGGLDNLEELLLSQNNIGGQIPSQFGNLSKLRLLAMSQNKLTGSIPKALGNLTALRFLYADENRLTGSIPAEIGNLTGLQELWLHKNMISGTLPAEISSLINLQKLLLNDNQINGNIPSFIGNMTRLVSFHISNNQLSGNIPVSLGNLTNLISLLLSDNMLTGPIPETFGNLASLLSLDAHNNMLSGEIPPSFGNMASLRRIYLHGNNLEGCFPASMQKYCPLGQSVNVNASGYNFFQNPGLIFAGDFTRWCNGEGRANAMIAAPANLCEGNDLKLAGTGGISYQWWGPAGFMSLEQNPVISQIKADQFGRYFLVVKNENRCIDTSFTDVKAVGSVTAGGNSPLCQGDSLSLTASGGLSYKWTGPDGFVSTLQNPVILNAGAQAEGIYTVEVMTADCIITRQVNVEFSKSASLISNGPVCEGDSLILSVSSGLTFNWKGPGQLTSQTSKVIIPVAQIGSGGVYSVEVTDASGCRFTLNENVAIVPRLIPTLQDFEGLCPDSPSVPLPASASGIIGVWSGQGVSGVPGSQEFSPAGLAGRQQLTFMPADSSGCVGSAVSDILVSQLSITSVNTVSSSDDEDSNGSALVTIDFNATDYSIRLSGTSAQQFENLNSTQISFLQLSSGEYQVQVTDSNGCIDTASFAVRHIRPYYFMPNVVSQRPTSPNNRFFLKGRNVLSYDMYVYDRWGNLMYSGAELQANDDTTAWQPERKDSGVFIYLLKVRSELGVKIVRGSVTVL